MKAHFVAVVRLLLNQDAFRVYFRLYHARKTETDRRKQRKDQDAGCLKPFSV